MVAWLLLDANCPVLLMRGGIPRKGLTAQWLQQLASSTEVSTPFCNIRIVILYSMTGRAHPYDVTGSQSMIAESHAMSLIGY